MLQRLYVHNYRCLENFELVLQAMPSSLLIGKNGAGKSTIANALMILQSIGRGTNRVGQLLQIKDFSLGRVEVPIRFEIDVMLKNKLFQYVLVLELPEKFRELRVSEEMLTCAGEPIFTRQAAQVFFHAKDKIKEAKFLVDWHLIALPIIQEQSDTDPLLLFKTWLARMIILAPIPQLMTGDSNGETLEPNKDGSNIGNWFSGLLGRYPAAYTHIENYLLKIMPDSKGFQNELKGKDYKSMNVQFNANQSTLSISFDELSDGEKCFFLCAIVLAANESYGPLFCFWDEPDNYLSLSEVGYFVTTLRNAFKRNGQIIMTSHNSEAIRKFSNENTMVLNRKSHLEPTQLRFLDKLDISGDLINAIISDDIIK